MSSLDIKKAEFSNSHEITKLHKKVIPLGLLSMLDEPFSEWVYQEILKNDTAFGFAVSDNQKLIGFVIATENSTNVFRSLLKNPIKLFYLLTRQLMKKPNLIFKLVDSVFYENSSQTKEPTLLSIAIDTDYQGQGIGSELIKSIRLEFKNRGVKRYRVEVHQANLQANKFYQKQGMIQGEQIKLYGYEWNIYYDKI